MKDRICSSNLVYTHDDPKHCDRDDSGLIRNEAPGKAEGAESSKAGTVEEKGGKYTDL